MSCVIEVSADKRTGWIKTRNLHVQLVPPTATSVGKIGKGFFILRSGRRAVVGNTKHSTDTRLRHRATNDNDFNGTTVRDTDKVDILETTPDGEFARVRAVDHTAEGWIKTRNLHIQMI